MNSEHEHETSHYFCCGHGSTVHHSYSAKYQRAAADRGDERGTVREGHPEHGEHGSDRSRGALSTGRREPSALSPGCRNVLHPGRKTYIPRGRQGARRPEARRHTAGSRWYYPRALEPEHDGRRQVVGIHRRRERKRARDKEALSWT